MKINRENLLAKLIEEKRVAFEYRERRHKQWDDNYLLFRGKVETNELTQRQEVCVPLLKGSVKSIQSKIGEKPEMTLTDKGGDMDKEIIVNEKWRQDYKDNSIELLDKVDKKQVLITGRSWKKLNWTDKFKIEIKDNFDMLIDPKVTTYDIETARYIIEMGIHRTVEEIQAETKYDKEGLADFQSMIDGLKGNETTGEKGEKPENITATNLTTQAMDDIEARNERMEALGADNLEESVAGADMVIELNQHFTNLWDDDTKKWVRYVCVVANESILLSAKPLKEVLGVDFWPFETWADDLEATDFYSDGIGDILRVPNQMVNIWYSQYMENRTLRNYGMNFYDQTKAEEWTAPEFEPRPGGWYPLPGRPAEIYQRVDIPDLGSNKDDIQFLINIAEKETASTDVEKGMVSDARRTLGEIEIAVSKAQERTSSMSPYYNLCWQRVVQKWYKLTEANMGKTRQTLFKKNANGKLVEKEVSKEDIISEKGYEIEVVSSSQKSVEQIDELNKLFAIKNEFPNNQPLKKAIQKRALKVANLAPEELQEIKDYEERISEMGIEDKPEKPAQVTAQNQIAAPVNVPTM